MESNESKNEAALRYQAMGLSIIPTGPDKKPLLSSWVSYQTHPATTEKIKEWWTRWPDANPALITGKVSGIVALDLDIKHGRKSSEFNIPATACSRSGSGGEHFFFKHPGVPVKTSSAVFGNGVDIRGDGGYILLAPSVNASGGKYEWTVPIEEGIDEMPDWLLEKTTSQETKRFALGEGVPEGQRNNAMTSKAGAILVSMPSASWESLGWQKLKTANEKNSPPLEEKELRTIWESVKRYHHPTSSDSNSSNGQSEYKANKMNQADEIVRIVKENPDVNFFLSGLDEPFMQFPVGNHKEHWPCRSKQVKLWLAREFWNRHEKTPNSESISAALNVLEATAMFDGKKYALSNRVALQGDELYYSLTNDEWEAVRITPKGWDVVKDVPILFRRYSHQEPQVIASGGGDLWNIFKYINIKNEEHQLLLLVWLVASFIPGFPHPVVYFHGPQGSAKSTASKILRRIIDPSKIEVAEFPKDLKELIQKLSHHWVLIFDNVSTISNEFSDILCRAVSGSGFSKRELYSDDSDIIYNLKLCVGLNGISLPHLNPDLLERSILLQLERVSKDNRKQEQDLLREFKEELPSLIGSIFDILSRSLAARGQIASPALPRMADFGLWGCAIAEALGRTKEEFLEAYNRNIGLQHDEVINDNIEASFIVQLMSDKLEWVGSATELLGLMEEKYENNRRVVLPKAANALSRKLEELKTNLAEVGISIERSGGQMRKFTIRNTGENIALIAPSLQLPETVSDGMTELFASYPNNP